MTGEQVGRHRARPYAGPLVRNRTGAVASTLLLTGVASAATVLVLTQGGGLVADLTTGRALSTLTIGESEPITVSVKRPVVVAPTPPAVPTQTPTARPDAAPATERPANLAPLAPVRPTTPARPRATARPAPTQEPAAPTTVVAGPRPATDAGETGTNAGKGIGAAGIPGSGATRIAGDAEVGHVVLCTSPRARAGCGQGYDNIDGTPVAEPKVTGKGSSTTAGDKKADAKKRDVKKADVKKRDVKKRDVKDSHQPTVAKVKVTKAAKGEARREAEAAAKSH